MIIHFKAAQNLAAEHYEKYFDLNFHFKLPQNLVSKHYERDFVMNFHLGASQNLVKRTMKEILTLFSALRRLKHGCRAL